MARGPRRYTEHAYTMLTPDQYIKLLEEQNPGEKVSMTLRRLLEERWAARNPSTKEGSHADAI
jgi:hypothetical protein